MWGQARTSKGDSPLSRLFYFLRARYVYWRGHAVQIPQNEVNSIPIIVNNYNRVSTLRSLLKTLEDSGCRNIHIIDNNSTYPPLLAFYDKCPYTLYRLRHNVGYKALWKTHLFKKFRHSYYVYTDSDVVLDDSCPTDFMQRLYGLLGKYKYASKVGLGIRTDDLPDAYAQKERVIEHERQCVREEIEPGVFRAVLDTTFAMYRPWATSKPKWCVEQYRTSAPYLIRHLPWYVDSAHPTEEEAYYASSTSNRTW